MTLAVLAFLGGFVGLVGGGELLVFATSALAISLNISQALIALTIVAFGSSLPELLISIMAAASGNSDLAVGNVIGSNIQNIGIIIGMAALVRPFKCDPETLKRNALIFCGAPILLFILAYNQNIARFEGLVLLSAFAYFIGSSLSQAKKEQAISVSSQEATPRIKTKFFLEVLAIIAGLVLLIFSAKAVLFGAIEIANYFGLSERIIGLTLVAFGTSLPELFICGVAAYRHKADIIIANIIGSNIFNTLGIVGVSASLTPMRVEKQAVSVDMIVMILFTMCAYLIFSRSKKIGRPVGVLLILSCLIYNYSLFL